MKIKNVKNKLRRIRYKLKPIFSFIEALIQISAFLFMTYIIWIALIGLGLKKSDALMAILLLFQTIILYRQIGIMEAQKEASKRPYEPFFSLRGQRMDSEYEGERIVYRILVRNISQGVPANARYELIIGDEVIQEGILDSERLVPNHANTIKIKQELYLKKAERRGLKVKIIYVTQFKEEKVDIFSLPPEDVKKKKTALFYMEVPSY